MKSFAMALLATTVFAVEPVEVAEEEFNLIVQDKLEALTLPPPPKGGSPVVFVQTDPMLYFMMDPTLTYSIPDLPDKGITLLFCLGGIFFLKEYVDHLNFKCKFGGIPVYNQNFDVGQYGFDMWTYCLPFDVPSYAPSTTYYVTVVGKSSAKTVTNKDLFSIDATFSLW